MDDNGQIGISIAALSECVKYAEDKYAKRKELWYERHLIKIGCNSVAMRNL